MDAVYLVVAVAVAAVAAAAAAEIVLVAHVDHSLFAYVVVKVYI